MKLNNKTAIVTGGGSGIGRTIAEWFGKEGAKVVVVDIVGRRAGETVQHIEDCGGHARVVESDVTRREMVDSVISEVLSTEKHIDVLVNNAATAYGNDLLEINERIWDLNLAVTLKSVYLYSRAVLPSMIAQRSGAIVNVGSVNGLAALGNTAYSVAKAAVINLTQNMAVVYGRYNVRVNVICAGTVRTPAWQSRLASKPDLFEKLIKWYPLGRVGEPEDIAKAALFLASDDASWITGTTLVVDGGLMAGNLPLLTELEARPPETMDA